MATQTGAKLTLPSEREMRVERYFEAPRELVWRAYTEPGLVARWWGRGHQVDIERDEVVRGGHWRYVEHSPDGSTDGFEGRYREVEPPTRISRTFEWDGMPGYPSVEEAIFEEVDGRTKVTSSTLFYTQEERDGMMQYGMEEGMNESYAALDALLAELQ